MKCQLEKIENRWNIFVTNCARRCIHSKWNLCHFWLIIWECFHYQDQLSYHKSKCQSCIKAKAEIDQSPVHSKHSSVFFSQKQTRTRLKKSRVEHDTKANMFWNIERNKYDSFYYRFMSVDKITTQNFLKWSYWIIGILNQFKIEKKIECHTCNE